jgi:hypothetical protein
MIQATPTVVVAAAAKAVTTSVNTMQADEPAPSEHALAV